MAKVQTLGIHLKKMKNFWYCFFLAAIPLPFLAPSRVWLFAAPPVMLLLLNWHIQGRFNSHLKKRHYPKSVLQIPHIFLYLGNIGFAQSVFALLIMMHPTVLVDMGLEELAAPLTLGETIAAIAIIIPCIALIFTGAVLAILRGREKWKQVCETFEGGA